MKVEINPRGNGACPLCLSSSDCKLRTLLAASMADAKKTRGPRDDDAAMEIVVYSCPNFAERF